MPRPTFIEPIYTCSRIAVFAIVSRSLKFVDENACSRRGESRIRKVWQAISLLIKGNHYSFEFYQ